MIHTQFRKHLVYLSFLYALFGCGTDQTPQDTIQITALKPLRIYPNTQVTILGYGFGILGVDDRVYLSTTQLEIISWQPQEIEVIIPSDIQIGHSMMTLMIEGNAMTSTPIEIRQEKE